MSLGELRAQNGLVWGSHLNGNSNDFSGSGNNGSDTAITYSQANGRFGQGAGFNGSSSKIRLPSAFPDFGTSAFSIIMKIYVANNSSEQALFFRQDNSTHNNYTGVFITNTGKLNLTIRGSEANLYSVTSDAQLSIGWHSLGVVSTGSNGAIKLYIDGSSDGSTNIGATTMSFGSAIPSIGSTYQQWIPFEGGFFNGKIDEYCIFNVAKSASWVRQQYAIGRFGEL